MAISFQGRVALITGAGAGLGRSYALFLAARGAKVLVNDLGSAFNDQSGSAGPAQQVAEEIRAAGGQAEADFGSVAEPQAAAEMVRRAVEAFGRLDIVINNAGILRDKSFAKMDLADFRLVHQVHLLGSAYVTHAAWPVMQGQGYGRVVLTTSTSGLYGTFGQSNYCSAKLALVGLMNALKLEGARYGIAVNCVAPMAHTRMSEPSGIFERIDPALLKPELVTPLVAYLASDACAVSGQVVQAGGGYFARAAVVEGPGLRLDPRGEITPEMIAQNYTTIADLEGARPFADSGGQIGQALDKSSA